MVQQDRNLPEGTDTVIPGATETRTSAADSATKTRGKSVAKSSSEGSGLMDKVRSSSSKLSDEAADKARGFVGQGMERSAEAISNVGKLIGDTASGIDDKLGQDYGDYARRAAEALESTANKLSSKDPDELIDDTRNFVRKSPGIALAGAAIVGFALARLVKSGLAGADEDEDNEGSGRSRR